MPIAERSHIAAFQQPIARILADRFKLPVTRLAHRVLGNNERFIYQPAE